MEMLVSDTLHLPKAWTVRTAGYDRMTNTISLHQLISPVLVFEGGSSLPIQHPPLRASGVDLTGMSVTGVERFGWRRLSARMFGP